MILWALALCQRRCFKQLCHFKMEKQWGKSSSQSVQFGTSAQNPLSLVLLQWATWDVFLTLAKKGSG